MQQVGELSYSGVCLSRRPVEEYAVIIKLASYFLFPFENTYAPLSGGARLFLMHNDTTHLLYLDSMILPFLSNSPNNGASMRAMLSCSRDVDLI